MFVDLRFDSPLYHYTSVPGFKGIISSKNFWLCNIAKSNDDRELEIGPEIFREYLSEHFARVLPREIALSAIFSVMETIAMIHAGNVTFYATCFTPDGKNPRMWSEYANQSSGVCIGLRARAVNDFRRSSGRVTKVAYIDSLDSSDNALVVKDMIVKTASDILRHKPSSPSEVVRMTSNIANFLAASIKSRSWEYENEVRLSNVQISDTSHPRTPSLVNPGEFVPRRPKRTMESSGRDYIETAFGRFMDGQFDPSGSIVTVSLGSECELTRGETDEFLRSEGFKNFTVFRHEG